MNAYAPLGLAYAASKSVRRDRRQVPITTDTRREIVAEYERWFAMSDSGHPADASADKRIQELRSRYAKAA